MGPHLTGHNDKYHMVSARKVPKRWTARHFMSVLRGFSLSTCINGMPPLRTRTFSIEGRQIALGTYIPSDKDGMNPALPHMG
jgi:hypothetical protein